jgi:hypothetical protein
MKETPQKKRISVHDIKQALLDPRFRETLPPALNDDVAKFLKNPGCSCNHPIYSNVMRKASKQVADYFPAKEAAVEEFEKEVEKLAKNEWQVINCNVNELADRLRALGPGRKQLEVARWQDQVTVIINHIDGVY